MTRDSTMWYIAGPKTMRLASRQILPKKQEAPNGKIKKIGWGGNLQNIEKSMREVYISDGWTQDEIEKLLHYAVHRDLSIFTAEERRRIKILVQTDQYGAEALIMAYDCEAGDYRQLFIHNVKPHVFVGLHLFKDVWKKKMREARVSSASIPIDIDEIIKTPIAKLKENPYWRDLDLLIKDSDNWSLSERYYYLAKQTVHSANYDIQANTFRMNILDKSGGKIVVTKDEAERFLMVYRSLFPEIPERNRRVRRQADDTKILFNMFGMPYYISQYQPTESNYKEYYSWTPQSTVGMITNIAFCNMQEFIEKEKLNWDCLINGHDSILSQCPIGEELHCATKQKEFIEQEFISTLDKVPFRMRSETQVGMNWSPKKDKNPLGLQEIKL